VGSGSHDAGDPTTTNLYVGNLSPSVVTEVGGLVVVVVVAAVAVYVGHHRPPPRAVCTVRADRECQGNVAMYVNHHPLLLPP